MADKRVVDYIRAQLPRGFTNEQIKQKLMSQGWAENEIDEATRVASMGMRPSPRTNMMRERKDIPGLVKFFAVCYYISAAILLLGSILMILSGIGIGAAMLGTLGSALGLLGFLGTGVLIAAAVPLVLFAILNFFIGKGLFKGRNWARVVVIIFSIIGLLESIISILMMPFLSSNQTIAIIPAGIPLLIILSLLGLVCSGFVAAYFLFSKKVKEAFL